MDSHKKSKHLRPGSALEHGAAHELDHEQWSRRAFLRNLGIAGGMSFLMSNMPVRAAAYSRLTAALAHTETDRVLVLIRLKGGNDGQNMIVPVFDYGRYRSYRPTIYIPENEIFPLNDAFGMPDAMEALQPLWQEGRMKVVHGVGYPEQNLSHFRSSDIWASASDAQVIDNSGWLGRYLSQEYPDYLNDPPVRPPAVQIGGIGNLMFNDLEGNSISVSVTDPEQLYEIAQNGQLYDVQNLPDCLYGEQLGYLRTVANSTFRYAEVIKQAYDAGANAEAYGSNLGRQLAMVARLIKGNLGTRLYMVTQDGYDTHAQQGQRHPALLRELSQALAAFYRDLAGAGRDGDVISCTLSEFGRRLEQNASGGTDHGAAAPLLLFGPGLNGSGLVGTAPDLQNLDSTGNLLFSTDFRQVYATLLENWLCLDGVAVDQILGRSFDRLEVGLTCGRTTAVPGVASRSIEHRAHYLSPRHIEIHYHLPQSTHVRIDVYNVLGQRAAQLQNAYQMAGDHSVSFRPSGGAIMSGQYFYRIQAGSSVGGQAIQIVR